METKRRARSATDKQQRRDQILDTALAMWADHSFASVSMADVAARSGLAKGTLYLYFETKEELFLAMLGQLLDAWFDELDAGLASAEGWDAARASELICATLGQHAALTRMLPIAASILEHNISLESARAYKERLLERTAHTGAQLERRLPFLGRGDGMWLLLQIYALVVGLGQMADPAPVVRQVLEAPEMAPLRVEFGPSIRRSLTTLLQGLTIHGQTRG
ncbi:MAG: TetR/AcrR family transcriptional regulator [Roseiflexaceae bacterium]